MSNDITSKKKSGYGEGQFYTLRVKGMPYVLPVAKVAEALGIHPKTVYRWEKGTQSPSKSAVFMMSVIFAGVLPFPGWDAFRIRDTGRRTYHKKPIYALNHNSLTMELNPSQIESWSWTANHERSMLKASERRLEAVTAERDALLGKVELLERELERVRDLLPKAEVIQLKDASSRV